MVYGDYIEWRQRKKQSQTKPNKANFKAQTTLKRGRSEVGDSITMKGREDGELTLIHHPLSIIARLFRLLSIEHHLNWPEC